MPCRVKKKRGGRVGGLQFNFRQTKLDRDGVPMKYNNYRECNLSDTGIQGKRQELCRSGPALRQDTVVTADSEQNPSSGRYTSRQGQLEREP